MEKILLTGGSGFIGTYFREALNQKNVTNLDLVPPSIKTNATYYQGDVRDKDAVSKAMSGCNAIIHLAAAHHDFGIAPDDYFSTNEGGTRVIVQTAEEQNIETIIFYSSVAVYGESEEPSNENKTPAPSNDYGASKLAGEKVLREWAGKDSKRKLIIIRPAVVYGPRNKANMYLLIKQIQSGLYFIVGDGKNIKSIAYVENLVNATLFLKEKLGSGIHTYNFADEPQLNTSEISTLISKSLMKRKPFHLPLSLAMLLATPFDLAIKLTGKNLPVSGKRVKKLATSTEHHALKIRNEGFESLYSNEQGIRKMVEWYLQ